MQHDHRSHTGDSNAMATTQQVNELIEEVRDFRNEVTQWRLGMEGRLVTTETQMKTIVGNGQKGRMKEAEDNIISLQNAKNHMYGVSVGAATVVTCIGWFIHELLK